MNGLGIFEFKRNLSGLYRAILCAGLHFMALLLEISSAALAKSQVQVQKAPWSSVKSSQFLMAKCILIQNLHIRSASAQTSDKILL